MAKKLLRDFVVESLAIQPLWVKTYLLNHCLRGLLGVLFRVEREATVVAPAGPSGWRFRMKLAWQGHVPYVLGTYEPYVFDVLRRYVKRGDFCIDAGAHLGYFTILMARLVGEEGHVAAFEPMPETLQTLRENVAMNHLTNVQLEATALSDQCGSSTLIFSAHQPLSSTPSVGGYDVEGTRSSIAVPAVTVDTYVDVSARRPSLIKIDVEGAELSVLLGAAETLRVARPILLIEVHGTENPASEEVAKFLSASGYELTMIGKRNREAFCLAVPKTGRLKAVRKQEIN